MAGSISRWLSYLSSSDLASEIECLVPIDELVSVPIMCVVFFCERMFERKTDVSEWKASSSFSL